MKKKHAMKWIIALRSGKYKQGKRLLYNEKNDTYCCLGVLNKLFPELNLAGSAVGSLNYYFRIGLDGPGGKLKDTHTSLWELNDGNSLDHRRSYSFDEIADIIQIEYVEGL